MENTEEVEIAEPIVEEAVVEHVVPAVTKAAKHDKPPKHLSAFAKKAWLRANR